MSRVVGLPKLREAEVRFRVVGATVDAEVAKNLHKVEPKLAPIFSGEALTHMPKRKGYAALLAASIRLRTFVKAKFGMTVHVGATGRREGRDVPKLNLGILRHPTFGRRGPGNWVNQTKGVRRGFVNDGAEKGFDLVGDAVEDALRATGGRVVKR